MSYRYNINHIVPKDLLPSNGSNINLHSPRFMEACKIQQIEIEELLPKNQNEIREMYKQEQFNREALILATQHYESRREGKLRIVLSERQRIIQEERQKQINYPEKFKPDRLFTLTGKVVKGPMLPETLEERRKLREMIVNQQREIDECLIRAEYECPNTRNVYRERLMQQRAEKAHNDDPTTSTGKIEVINGDEYRKATKKDCLGDIPNIKKLHRSSFYIKPWRRATRLNGKQRRHHQRLVYANEILRFMEDDKTHKPKETKKKTNYLYFLRKQKGSYLEHDYIWRQGKRTQEIQDAKAVKNFYQQALKLAEDDQIREERRKRIDHLTLTQYARNQSKKVLDSKKETSKESPIKKHTGGKSYEARVMKRLNLSYDEEDHSDIGYLDLDVIEETDTVNNKKLDSVHCYNAAESSEEEWEDNLKANHDDSGDEDNEMYAKKINDSHFRQSGFDGMSTGDIERPLRSGISSMRTTGTFNLNPSRMLSSNGLKYYFDSKIKSQSSSEGIKNRDLSFGKENNQDEYRKLANIGLRMSEDDDLYQTIRRDMFSESDSLQHWKHTEGQDKKFLKRALNTAGLKAKNTYI